MKPRILQHASLRCAWFAAWCVAALAAQGATGPVGPTYPVSDFVVEYALDHPRHIPEVDVLDLEVGLTSVGSAYTAPRPVDRTVRMRLSSLPEGAQLTATAIQHINQYIVSTFNRSGYNGVIVTVPDIDEQTGRDLRPGGDTQLHLRIWTGRVSRVATLADGPRFASLTVDERTNHHAHEWIRERAPVQPGGERGLLDVHALEEYAAALSRHRGRRVDVELSPGPVTGTSDVTLRVAENKPWSVYAQYSNTGTSSTTKNRERFGFSHDQLLSRDDSLRVDYTTGDFDEVTAVNGSYEGPFSLAAPRLRFRLRGLYSKFDASEVGIVDTSSDLHGEQWLGEGDLIANVLQRDELFVDLSAGARYHQMRVNQSDLLGSGGLPLNRLDRATVDYVVPSVGVQVERSTRISDLHLALGVDAGFTDASKEERAVLGNEPADKDFVLVRGDGSYSFYLEPLIDRFAWEDPSTPESSTLAHEIALSLRGQWALDHRLVPQYQQIAGGFFSVRGYKQASVAGDSLLLGSAEYRLHLPRLFAPAPPPAVPVLGRFRWRPEAVYGQSDWDLIFRLFSDAAQVWVSHPVADESDESLLSVGGGVELQLLRNLSLRLDAGRALSNAGGSEAGDMRGHVLATLVY
ncbi:MAG: ShlB/FhaC/HecB family hemolysin secretion/activation protein [Candidatus Eiseniibacteriota bacterium]|jgi:hemolysin activation/secretion protein